MAKEKQFEVRDRRAKDRFYLDDLYLNGYARLCGIYATGVYLSLCRHANLDQKCWPSIKKIAEELAVSEKQVGRAIKILEENKIIAKERVGKKANNRYWLLNKSEWTHSPISERTGSPITTDWQSDHQGTGSPFHSKDTHIKETHSKDSNPRVAEVINLFKDINPSYKGWFNNTTQRKSAATLLEQHGFEKVSKAVNLLARTNSIPYITTITTPYMLETKWALWKAQVEKKMAEKQSKGKTIIQ